MNLVDSFYEFLSENYYNDIEDLALSIQNLAKNCYRIGGYFTILGKNEALVKFFERVIKINSTG
jgi:hypothetical protein